MSNDSRCIERTLLIDADDTLWENNVFYLQCTARFQDLMADLACSRGVALDLLDDSEQEMIPIWGYGPQGYVAALALACEKWLSQSGQSAEPDVLARARACGESVLSPPMVLIADVEETLQVLRPTSQLVLVSKGIEETQRAKLRRSGLAPLFDACHIVAEKTPEVYRSIADALGLNPRDTWMVGNSPKSDINPAIEAGLGAIFIPHDHTWTAELQDLRRPDLVITLRRFADLPHLFGVEVPWG